jgi:hypothetical protein
MLLFTSLSSSSEGGSARGFSLWSSREVGGQIACRQLFWVHEPAHFFFQPKLAPFAIRNLQGVAARAALQVLDSLIKYLMFLLQLNQMTCNAQDSLPFVCLQ